MFISFEGIDGSGKSTQARLLEKTLVDHGYSVHSFREPGGTEVSERIRSILLDSQLQVDPFAEMLLFAAARAQLSRTRLATLLEADSIVICDRFYDSSVAYQAGGREIVDPDWMDEFQRRVTGGLIPDRTYLIKVPLDKAFARRNHRNTTTAGADRMERSGRSFFKRVEATYERIARLHPERIVVLDGERSPSDIAADIEQDVQLLLGSTPMNPPSRERNC